MTKVHSENKKKLKGPIVDGWIEPKESELTSSDEDSSGHSSSDSDSSGRRTDVENLRSKEDEEDEETDAVGHKDSEVSAESTVDYTEMTPLFKAIDEEEWDSVLTFLTTDQWPFKFSSFVSSLFQDVEKPASVQVRTWVAASNEDGEMCRLPIHAAIIREAPFRVINALVMIYPKSVESPDSEGHLPLHLAYECRNPDLNVLALLLRTYPEGIHKQNEVGQLPMECGAGSAITEISQIFISETKASVEKQLLKEKSSLEEDRKQLMQVTQELMELKRIVAQRERKNEKHQKKHQKKQHMSTSISDFARRKIDHDAETEKELKLRLEKEKRKVAYINSELAKTQTELQELQNMKAKDSSKAHRTRSPRRKTRSASAKRRSADNEELAAIEQAKKAFEDTYANPDAPPEKVQGSTVETNETRSDKAETKADPSGKTSKNAIPNSPQKLRFAAARFKKKLNWRKSAPPDAE